MKQDNIHNSIIIHKKHSFESEDALLYEQQHLRVFLLDHPAINKSKIETLCNVPRDTLRHFLKERRNLPLKYFNSIRDELMKYGFIPLSSE